MLLRSLFNYLLCSNFCGYSCKRSDSFSGTVFIYGISYLGRNIDNIFCYIDDVRRQNR